MSGRWWPLRLWCAKLILKSLQPADCGGGGGILTTSGPAVRIGPCTIILSWGEPEHVLSPLWLKTDLMSWGSLVSGSGLLGHEGWMLEVRKEPEIKMLPQLGDWIQSYLVGQPLTDLESLGEFIFCCSHWGMGTSSISVTWEHLQNAEPEPPRRTFWIRICVLKRSPDIYVQCEKQALEKKGQFCRFWA